MDDVAALALDRVAGGRSMLDAARVATFVLNCALGGGGQGKSRGRGRGAATAIAAIAVVNFGGALLGGVAVGRGIAKMGSCALRGVVGLVTMAEKIAGGGRSKGLAGAAVVATIAISWAHCTIGDGGGRGRSSRGVANVACVAVRWTLVAGLEGSKGRGRGLARVGLASMIALDCGFGGEVVVGRARCLVDIANFADDWTLGVGGARSRARGIAGTAVAIGWARRELG